MEKDMLKGILFCRHCCVTRKHSVCASTKELQSCAFCTFRVPYPFGLPRRPHQPGLRDLGSSRTTQSIQGTPRSRPCTANRRQRARLFPPRLVSSDSRSRNAYTEGRVLSLISKFTVSSATQQAIRTVTAELSGADTGYEVLNFSPDCGPTVSNNGQDWIHLS